MKHSAKACGGHSNSEGTASWSMSTVVPAHSPIQDSGERLLNQPVAAGVNGSADRECMGTGRLGRVSTCVAAKPSRALISPRANEFFGAMVKTSGNVMAQFEI